MKAMKSMKNHHRKPLHVFFMSFMLFMVATLRRRPIPVVG